MGTQSCLDFASDGFTITGMNSFYRFNVTLTLVPNDVAANSTPVGEVDSPMQTYLVATAPFDQIPDSTNFNVAGVHIGSIVQCTTGVMDIGTSTTGTEGMFLLTAPRDYANSGTLALAGLTTSNALAAGTANSVVWFEAAAATYGQIRVMYAYLKNETGTA